MPRLVPEEPPDLRTNLGSTATRHGHEAMSAYRDGDWERFYMHAGIALEHAMKARLAGESPYLLAPNGQGWFVHGYRFASGDVRASGLRSVSATEALGRLKLMQTALVSTFFDQVSETLERRNRIAHLGLFETPSDEDLLSHAASFVHTIEQLLRIAPADFWENHAGLAAKLVEDELDAVRVRVEAKLARARDRLAAMDDDQRAAMVEVATRWVATVEDSDFVELDCPVCESVAGGGGELTDEGEPEWDPHEPGPVGWDYDIKTVLTWFNCRVCGLDLGSADEVAAGGLPAEVDSERATPEDLYEPDW